MALPDHDELRTLLDWSPPLGVLSVYLGIDHTDRGQGWRIELHDRLREALSAVDEQGAGHDLTTAAKATAERFAKRFGPGDKPPDARGLIAFCEIAASGEGEERSFLTATPPRRIEAAIAERPLLRPLTEIIDDNRRLGVVAVTGERARILEWDDRTLTEIDDEEILTTGDWRERKAPRSVNTPSGQQVSSSGRDHHEARLEDHRQRFVDRIGERVGRLAGERSWHELIVFGEGKRLGELEERLDGGRVVHCEDKNVIPEPLSAIADRVAALAPRLNRERELRLIGRAEEGAMAGGRGALGAAETAQALAQGRVEHLLFAADRARELDQEELRAALAGTADGPGSGDELLVAQALRTDATVTPVEGSAAERLAEHGGVGAILRY